MAKLVVLKKGSAGASYELTAERTTVGRMDDNAFQIDEPSVSSHHCEILQNNGAFIVKDLGSTNGTYINGEKVNESPIKPGKSMVLGEIEVRLDTEETEKQRGAEQQPVRPVVKGVSLTELKSETRKITVDEKAFAKKDDKMSKYFIIGGVVLGVLIVGFLIYALFLAAGNQ